MIRLVNDFSSSRTIGVYRCTALDCPSTRQARRSLTSSLPEPNRFKPLGATTVDVKRARAG
jgi:hypothetical protein